MAARIADVSEVLLFLGLTGTATELQRSIANVCLGRAEAAVRRHLQYDPVQESRTEFYPQTNFRTLNREGVWEADDVNAYIKYNNAYWQDELQLTHLPIRSITSLNVDYDGRSGTKDGAFGAGTAWTEGTQFWANYDMQDSSGNKLCSDGILKAEGGWPSEPGTVKIVYTAGYTDAEFHGDDEVVDASNILEAVIDEAVRRVKKAFSRMKSAAGLGTGPFSSESLGDYSYTVDSAIFSRLVGGGIDLLPETEVKLANHVNFGLSFI